MNITVNLSDSELKALSLEISDVESWIENAIKEKARKLSNKIIEEAMLGKKNDIEEDYLTTQERNNLKSSIGFVPNLAALSSQQRDQIIMTATVPTSQQRNDFLNRQIANRVAQGKPNA